MCRFCLVFVNVCCFDIFCDVRLGLFDFLNFCVLFFLIGDFYKLYIFGDCIFGMDIEKDDDEDENVKFEKCKKVKENDDDNSISGIESS